MPKFKLSTLMTFFILLFIITDLIGYKYIIQNIKEDNARNEQILFYKLQRKTNELLTNLLYMYSIKKDLLEEKHKYVLNYLNEKQNLDINLNEIYEKINEGDKNYPFNIYITDEHLKIVNTTFKPDMGFDLSFAKEIFEQHKKDNVVGISGPVFETYSTNFFSFSDSYIQNTNRILQVSFRYPGTREKLTEIQNLIEENKMIVKSDAYITFKDGYIGDFIFKAFKPYKQNIDEINKRLKEGRTLDKKIQDDEIGIEYFIEANINHKALFFSQNSTIFDDAKIIYNVVFSQKDIEETINKINILFMILTIVAILTIIALFKIRYKEILLTQNDIFIKHSVHEIKTPLSIISLNNQLRDKLLGKDKYSIKINSAIKTLQNSYDDMTYLLTKDKITYDVIDINLGTFLEKRVEYFNSIANVQSRSIDLNIENNCRVKISEIELTRLIDNNLSNAIKYSEINSEITINLLNGVLTFSSIGKEIIDTKAIFKKYKREDLAVGGNGLGLSIVLDISKKYNIKIDVKRKNNVNSFTYTFNCHSIDISEV